MSSDWTPVIDISQFQGDIDFGVMRTRGVKGLIMRAVKGLHRDTRVVDNVGLARAAGYADSDIGFYTFLRPTEGSALDCAVAALEVVEESLGHTDTFLMIDVEDYRLGDEKEDLPPVFGAEFVAYIRATIDEVRSRSPQTRITAYANLNSWNGWIHTEKDGEVASVHKDKVWVDDDDLAASLDFMVAKYHRRDEQPPPPDRWPAWAMETGVVPDPPRGATTWAGWQFSADGNGQAEFYGCAPVPGRPETGIDLNIVRTEKWAAWTTPAGPAPVSSGAAPDAAGSWQALASGQGLGRGRALSSGDGRLRLVHLDNGEVVLQRVLWSTGTAESDTSSIVMQRDGNLVLYSSDLATPLWNSGTHGNAGAELRVEGGQPVIVAADGRKIWP
ncbi:MAG: GH25 family lysozyme [Ilumatobacteraceae bacterium]